eukprot:Skav232848  [mRNA]  locus=scaffold1834:854513:884699:- [translate_table: standard]
MCFLSSSESVSVTRTKDVRIGADARPERSERERSERPRDEAVPKAPPEAPPDRSGKSRRPHKEAPAPPEATTQQAASPAAPSPPVATHGPKVRASRPAVRRPGTAGANLRASPTGRTNPMKAQAFALAAQQQRTVAQVSRKVVLKTGLKLNPKKLYGADGYAELLRLASVLYEAQKSVGDVALSEPRGEDFALNSKRLADLKSTRSLCSQIVESGAMLFELLQKDPSMALPKTQLMVHDHQFAPLGSERESEMVETAVKQLLGSHGQSLEQLKQMSDELQRDEKSLEGKIKKKKQELERCRKRLGSLASVRPAFMDEYEQLEQELERFYEQYVGRFRNLDYLEHEIDVLNKEEQDRMEENDRALKRMQKRLRDEEWRLLRGEEDQREGRERKAEKTQEDPWAEEAAVVGPGTISRFFWRANAAVEDCSFNVSSLGFNPPTEMGMWIDC